MIRGVVYPIGGRAALLGVMDDDGPYCLVHAAVKTLSNLHHKLACYACGIPNGAQGTKT